MCFFLFLSSAGLNHFDYNLLYCVNTPTFNVSRQGEVQFALRDSGNCSNAPFSAVSTASDNYLYCERRVQVITAPFFSFMPLQNVTSCNMPRGCHAVLNNETQKYTAVFNHAQATNCPGANPVCTKYSKCLCAQSCPVPSNSFIFPFST